MTLFYSSNSLTWDQEGNNWRIETDNGRTYLHLTVTMDIIENAIEGLVLDYGKEALKIYITEKICRRKPNEDDALID